MRTSTLFASLSFSIVAAVLSSCNQGGGISGSSPGGTGPFDRNGNYVESWADNPSKWGKRNSSPVSDDVPPSIASNEQPPSNAIPLSDSKPPTLVRSTSKPVRAREVEVASRKKGVEVTSRKKEVEVASRKKEVTSKPKPKVVAKATKPKSSSSSRCVVKQGDSLSLIAARNKTTVSALQRANGISGTLIHPGKTLIIPR